MLVGLIFLQTTTKSYLFTPIILISKIVIGRWFTESEDWLVIIKLGNKVMIKLLKNDTFETKKNY